MSFGLGCALGCLNHTLLAALGVSALIAASPIAFTTLKIAGGLYLVYLGVHALRSRGSSLAYSRNERLESQSGLFLKGLFVNSINPKVVLFFLAFLPQFVTTNQGNAGWQIAQLGVLFTMQAALIFGALGYFAGRLGQWMGRNPKSGMWLDRIAGSIFVGLGLRLMVSR